MWERGDALRREAFEAVDGIVARARDTAQVDPSLEALPFYWGIAALSRPLPRTADRVAAHEIDWLISVYVRGLRPGGTPQLPSVS